MSIHLSNYVVWNSGVCMVPNKNILHSEELHLFKTTGQDFERMTVLQANHILYHFDQFGQPM